MRIVSSYHSFYQMRYNQQISLSLDKDVRLNPQLIGDFIAYQALFRWMQESSIKLEQEVGRCAEVALLTGYRIQTVLKLARAHIKPQTE